MNRLIQIFVLFLIMLLVSTFFLGLGKKYSTGTREGLFGGSSKKGIISKTYTCTIKTKDNYFHKFDTTKDIYLKLQDYSGKQIKIYYNQYLIKPHHHVTKYFCYKVDILALQND